MTKGEFERLLPGGQYLDKATEQARHWSQRQPAWCRDWALEEAQSWRNHRWSMWRSHTTAKWIERERG